MTAEMTPTSRRMPKVAPWEDIQPAAMPWEDIHECRPGGAQGQIQRHFLPKR